MNNVALFLLKDVSMSIVVFFFSLKKLKWNILLKIWKY